MDAVADLSRRLANLIRLGTVAAVDHAAARCTVLTGGLRTAPLPWHVFRAGDARQWWAPSVGEQVILLSPSGDPAAAVVLVGLYSDAHPRPAGSDTAHVTDYPDGARVAYDPATHQLDALLPAGGKAHLAAPGGVAIDGDTTITGTLRVTGASQFGADMHCDATLTADTDVKGGGISLKTHKHGGVQSGGSLSGVPQ